MHDHAQNPGDRRHPDAGPDGRVLATLIAGPTASGKSALAIRIARALQAAEGRDCAIVNADSMQVYADLRVLSARPSAEEEAGVPHRLYGFVPAGEEFSVGRFIAAIGPLIEAARRDNTALVIVGGTGLYFRALTQGLMPTPAIPHQIRRDWRGKAEAGHDLHAELTRRDPVRAAMLNPADTPRLLRAIELHAATGRAYSDWLQENPGEPLLKPEEYRGVFLDPPREALHAAIDRRFEAMMEAGALDEARALAGREPKLSRNLGVMKAHGMPHLVDFIEGRLPRSEAIARGQADTRRYARRQVIFARKYLVGPNWRWFSSAEEAGRALLGDQAASVLPGGLA